MTEAERTIETPEDTPTAEPAGPRRDEPATDAATDAAGASGARLRRRVGVLASVAITAYLLDLATKIMVVLWLEPRAEIPVFGEWLTLHAVRNSGAAFGMGQALTVVFTCIAAIVVVVILRLARKLYSVPWAIALGLLLGGALGNLTDRIFRAPGVFQGAVVDFIAPKHFAVFNLADSAIVCGGILIVLLSFRGLDPDGTVHRDEPAEEDKQSPEAKDGENGEEAEDRAAEAGTAATDGERTERAADDTGPDRPGTDAGDKTREKSGEKTGDESGTRRA